MDWESIREEFEISDISLTDLAEKHGISPSTLRSRKSREKWKKRGSPDDATQQKKTATRNATQRKNVATKKAVERLEGNEDLSEQQKQFCLEYSRFPNATKAYQTAYGCSYTVANKNAYALMVNHGIRAEIRRIQEARSKDWLVNDATIINEWIKMAFTDLTDFVEFRKVFVEYQTDEEGMPQLDDNGEMIPYYRNEVHFKDSQQVDGTVIQEVKKGKDGVSLKLYDKQRALIELQKLIGGESTLKLQLIQAQVDKINNDLKVDTTTEDKLKGYFTALRGEIDAT